MLFIFDMGGVVTRDDNFDAKLERLLGMTAIEFNAICAGNRNRAKGCPDIMLQLSNGEITSREFWKEFAARSEKECKADRGHQAYDAPRPPVDPWSLVFNPERDEKVVNIISRLRKKHRVVCGTNTIECHYMEHIERGDYALFDKVYASNRIGVSKPETDFWLTILMAEDVKAQDAFFTDDREENCQAASALGIKTHQFTNAAMLEDALKEYL